MKYIYTWGPRMKGLSVAHDARWQARKGAGCTIVARGAMNTALVEFGDGSREFISRNALRRALPDRRRGVP